MPGRNKRNALAMLPSLCFMLFFAGQALAAQVCLPSITATTSAKDFILNADGTAIHIKTGLMWKRCLEGQTWDGAASACTGSASTFTWQNALQQAQTVNNGAGFAGHNDWRMPNIKELASIVELQCTVPAINATVFPGVNGEFWSSSPEVSLSQVVQVVDFRGGGDSSQGKTSKDELLLVRTTP